MLAEWTKLTVKSTVVGYFLHGTHNFFFDIVTNNQL